jgi:hypothetical protein
MRQNDPLRALSDEERAALGRLSRSGREAAAVVARAKALLAVADGASYSAAARRRGWPGAARGMPSASWSRASIGRGWRRWRPGTEAGSPRAIRAPNGSASWPKRAAPRSASGTGRRPGRW